MEKEARDRVASFQRLAAGNPAEARRVLEALLDNPLVFTATLREGLHDRRAGVPKRAVAQTSDLGGTSDRATDTRDASGDAVGDPT
jgi:hypothetical protein